MPWQPSVVWLILLILFAGMEAATAGLVSVWFAVGAAAALLTSLATGSLLIQTIVFLAVSLLALLALRPLTRKFVNPKIVPTNFDRIIGATAVVTEEIDNLKGRGAVTIGGVTWTARAEQPDRIIPAGTAVQVLWIEGVKVFVRPAAPDGTPEEPRAHVIQPDPEPAPKQEKEEEAVDG